MTRTVTLRGIFPGRKYWSGLPFRSPGIFPTRSGRSPCHCPGEQHPTLSHQGSPFLLLPTQVSGCLYGDGFLIPNCQVWSISQTWNWTESRNDLGTVWVTLVDFACDPMDMATDSHLRQKYRVELPFHFSVAPNQGLNLITLHLGRYCQLSHRRWTDKWLYY